MNFLCDTILFWWYLKYAERDNQPPQTGRKTNMKSTDALAIPTSAAGDSFGEKNDIAIGMAIPDHRVQNMPLRDIENIATKHEIIVVKQQDIPKDPILSLPDDVKKNMIGYEDMELDQYILRALNSYADYITVDKLVLTLWFQFTRKADRMKLIKRLRILQKENKVAKASLRRGLYQITENGKKEIGF